jgi:hypothetical protein
MEKHRQASLVKVKLEKLLFSGIQTAPPFLTNYPLAGCSSRQRYSADQSPAAIAAALEFNCAELGLELKPSAIPTAGLGCFTTIPFRAGMELGYMWGKMCSSDTWHSIAASAPDKPHDPTHVNGEENYVAPAEQGSLRYIAGFPTTLKDGIDGLIGSQQCPFTFVNAAATDEQVNAAIVWPKETYSAHLHPNDSLRQASAYQYIAIVATMDMEEGTEIVFNYHYNELAWNEINKRVKLSNN